MQNVLAHPFFRCKCNKFFSDDIIHELLIIFRFDIDMVIGELQLHN